MTQLLQNLLMHFPSFHSTTYFFPPSPECSPSKSQAVHLSHPPLSRQLAPLANAAADEKKSPLFPHQLLSLVPPLLGTNGERKGRPPPHSDQQRRRQQPHLLSDQTRTAAAALPPLLFPSPPFGSVGGRLSHGSGGGGRKITTQTFCAGHAEVGRNEERKSPSPTQTL